MACGWLKLPSGVWKKEQGIQINDMYASDHMISKGLTSLSKFEKHVQQIEDDFWGNRFKDYAEWKERWYRMYKKYGYIDLVTGFRCSGVMGKNDCINYPVQGAAFHCLLWSFIEMDKRLTENKMDTKLIGQIHDSMILDVNPSELEEVQRMVRKITCEDLANTWKWIIVPLDVEIETYEVNGNWTQKIEAKS
jgi:DNA polymerase I-like protein with 3'-5' exonuclease and polymerase domains